MDTEAINIALVIFRCVIGSIMLAHGLNHIFGGGKIAGTGRWFESLGMKPGLLHAWLASIVEVIGGALLVLGFLMPFAGASVVGVMVVAWITNHRGNGFFIFRPGEGWEYVMALTACGLVLAVLGAGEWSLDNVLELWSPNPGWAGLAIAAGAGGGGAVALLAGFWRPTPKAVEAN
jgi:putative oxidoreductase